MTFLFSKVKERNILQSIENIQNRPLYMSMIFFVIVFFVIFATLYVAGGDPIPDDNYFHFKYAELLRTEGWSAVENFDWIYLVNDHDGVHHYSVNLHQVLLIPFTFFGDKLIGMHVSIAFYISFFVTIFFYIMKKERLKGGVFFSLVTISTTYVLTRMLLGRAFGIMIGLVFLEFYLAIHKRYKLLALLVFLHVLFHQATYFLPIIIIGMVEIVRYLISQKIVIKNFIATVIGVIFGLMFLPGFPYSLFERFRDILNIQSAGTGTVSGSISGAELTTKDFMTYFVGQNLIFFAFIFCVISALLLYYFVQKKEELSMKEGVDQVRLHWVYALFLFLMFVTFGSVVVSGRFFDFVLPTVALLGAFVFTIILEKNILSIDRRFSRWFGFGCYLWMGFIMIHMMMFVHMKSGSFDYNPAQLAAKWIEDNSRGKKEKVYLHNWGNFSLMFFGNTDDTYSTGIEPDSLRSYDEDLYWKYYNILKHNYYCETSGDCIEERNTIIAQLGDMDPSYKEVFMKKNSENIINSIKNDFDAKFVLSDSNEFDKLMWASPELIDSWQSFDSERYDGPHMHFTVFKLK